MSNHKLYQVAPEGRIKNRFFRGALVVIVENRLSIGVLLLLVSALALAVR